MKLLSVLLFFPIISLTGESLKADVYVDGYYRNNGTYVQPYRRTSPNQTNVDNYSFPGNANPNTGTFTPYKKNSSGGLRAPINNKGTCRDIVIAGIC